LIHIKTVLLFFTLLFFTSCSESLRQNHTANIPSQNTVATDDGIKINAYFSQTSGNYNEGGGIDDLLITDINNAENEILVAIYSLTNDRIRDAIINAYKRGLRVLIYTDEKELFKDDMKIIKETGIQVLSDEDTHALMHDKFTIIDQKTVWSGSCNYTYYAFYRNNENLVKIRSSKIAKVYRDEFFELWNRKLIEKAYVSSSIEIYFSPEDDFKERLLGLIANAKKKIYFLAFAFTDEDIAEALLIKAQEGVIIKGVFDEKQNSYQKSSQYTYLKEEGLDVKLDGNKFTLHDKIMIIDDTVVTGSYNFTDKANDTNNENSIVVHNNAFTARYLEEFQKIYAQAKD